MSEIHSSVIQGELRGRIIPPPLPPAPPLPPPGAAIEQLRETVEVQARTIRYLLSNYEMLLRKVEREMNMSKYYKIETVTGEQKTFHAGDDLPNGWWIPLNAALVHFNNFTGSHHAKTVDQFEPIFSDGHATAQGNITLIPIVSNLVRTEDD